MKNLLLILAFPFFFLSNNYAQAPGILWQKALGGSEDERIYCLQSVTGGYITAGYSTSNDGDVSGNHGSCDFWITKVNFNGDIQWQTSLGGSQCDLANSITETTDGGYAVVGSSYSSDGDVSDNYGGWDIWIVKLNASGTIQWERSIGDAGHDEGKVVKATDDGGYIMAGSVFDVNGGVRNALVTKFDAAGNIQWFKIFDGVLHSILNSIELSDDGGYVAVGRHSSGLGDYNVWVLKLNAIGDLQWQNFFGGSDDDEAYAVVGTIDGGYILAGETNSNDGDVTYNEGGADFWVIKFNDSGNLQWERTFGGTTYESARSIQETFPDYGYIISGITLSNDGDVSGNHGNYDAWVVKLSPSGILEWQKCLGGSLDDTALSIYDSGNGRYTLAGYTYSNDGDVSGNHGAQDALLIRLFPTPANDEACSAILIPADGTVQDGFSNVGAMVASGEDAIVPPNIDNNCVISWCDTAITNSVWFSFVAPSTGVVEVSTCDMTDFDTQIAVYSVGDCSDFGSYNLLQANDDGLGCLGFSSKMDVYDLTPGQTYYIIVDGYNGEVGGFSIQVTPIEVSATKEVLAGSQLLSAYPNPSSGQLTISMLEKQQIEAYSLSDLTGKVVIAIQLEQPLQKTEMELGVLEKGVYILQVRSEGRIFSEKIIVQ